jgi:hypothetical protein
MVKALCHKLEGRGFETGRSEICIFFFNLPNPSMGFSQHLTDMSFRSRKVCVREIDRCRCIGLTNLPPSVSRLTGKFGMLNILHSYSPSRPVAGKALLLIFLLSLHTDCTDHHMCICMCMKITMKIWPTL